MSSAPESQLLHYRLIEKLGEGGMGVVWKALDTSLDREVAIKLLPAEVSANPERLARFEREAKLLASLSHPNIATIHGLHEANGTHFIAMEYVRGEDLSLRLQRGPLPLDEALAVTRQIAEALESAHEQGVVHRDLKPANVVVDGEKVQVLDFGLAKALSVDGASGAAGQLSTSPTVTSAQTRDGMILGTAAYMSPEQARGKAVDKRADIWSFGCVLFEVLTAKTAYAGETISDTLVAVLSGEPDWAALPANTPQSVRRLLARCLEKDARRRLRDIGEARVVLEDALAAGTDLSAFGVVPSTTDAAELPIAGRGLPASVWVLLAFAAAVMFAAGWVLRAQPEPSAAADPMRSIRRLTYDAGLSHEPALSPDGNYVAYATDRAGNLDIEILPLGGGSVNRLTTDPADDSQPRWSPDGTRLAFVSARDHVGGLLVSAGGVGRLSTYVTSEGGDIFVMPALGGTATKLIESGAYPTWSPDGNAIAFQSNRAGGHWRIWSVPTSGGAPSQLTSGVPERLDFHPAWSPDGRWIAFASQTPSVTDGVFVVAATGGDAIQLFEGAAVSPAWSADGSRLYFSSSLTAADGVLNLWSIAFDPKAGINRELRRETFGIGSDYGASPAARDHKVAFASVSFSPDIWALDLSSRELRRITTTAGSEDYPHLNPDGRRLIFESDRTELTGLWVLDLVDGGLQPVANSEKGSEPRWSPDGNYVAYRSVDHDDEAIVAIQRWGDTTREVIGGVAGNAGTGLQWSPDGKWLSGSDSLNRLWLFERGGEAHVLIDNGGFPTWSPDGKTIAYQREAGHDHREIWALPVAGDGEPYMLSGGDVHYSHPQWNPVDADRLVVVIDHKDLGILRVSTGQVERVTGLASSTVLVDYPSWSADGRTVYFSLARMSGDLFLIEQ